MRQTDYCMDGASDSRPRRLEDQNTFEVISFQYLALNGINNGRRNTEGGDSHRAWLCLDRTRKRCSDYWPSIRLPVSVQCRWTSRNALNSPEGIHNRAFPLTDVFVVQIPCHYVDGHDAKETQAGEVVDFEMVSAKSL